MNKSLRNKILIILSILMLASPVFAEITDSQVEEVLGVKDEVVLDKNETELLVVGEHLNEAQINQMKNHYNIKNDNIQKLVITNEEEHRALGKYISAETITNKSMSFAYINLLPKGSGIKVETYNINWVTEDMYRNALATAGIKDAEVLVAGPFPVSGTAALTGSMKAYELLTGEDIGEEEKDVANEELITTADLSDDIGKDEAEKLMSEIKYYIIDNKPATIEEIEEVVEEAAKNNNVELTEEQKQKITELMDRVSNLEIDSKQIKEQISDIISKLDNIEINTEEVKGILTKILESIKQFFNKLFN